MSQGIKNVFYLFRDTFLRWLDDDGPRLGASLSFYTAFSLAPLILLSISIAGLIFGQAAAEGKILNELKSTMGLETARAIEGMVEAAHRPASGLVATIIGFTTLLFGASVVMNDLKYTLNKIWRVQTTGGIETLIRDKLLSFGLVLVIGFLLLVSLMVSASLAALGSFLDYLVPISAPVIYSVNLIVSLATITFLFACMFKILPNVNIRWSDVWVGAAITSLLFTVGKFVLALYLGRETIGSAYGTAGAVLVMLLWIYYSAHILYLGAEFTKLYTDRYGSGAKPSLNY